MGTTSSYQAKSSTTKLPGDKFASAWYINTKGYKWAKYEEIIDNDLVTQLVPGKHIRYPTAEDDDFCLVSSEKYGMNVYRNTPEQVKAFWASREAGSDDKTAGEQAVAARPQYQQQQQPQQKTINNLRPPVAEQEQKPAALFPQRQPQTQTQTQAQAAPLTQTAMVAPSHDDVPANRVAIMLKWNFWEDPDGLALLARNYAAGWIVEKLDSRNDGHLVLMRRKN